MAKKTIPRDCENCQSPFLAEAYEINKGSARFCSRLCANRFIRKGGSVRTACPQCGKAIIIKASVVKKGAKHCSRKCRNAAVPPIEQRFWSKVDKSPGHGPNGDCWQWTRGVNKDGYGIIKMGRETRGAHVASFEMRNGPIAQGLSVLHRCDNPPCVNPEHLFVGTQTDNMRDMDSKGRRSLTAHVKLSESQVVQIRAEYAAGGISYAELGRRHRVSASAINHIVHRRTWITTV